MVYVIVIYVSVRTHSGRISLVDLCRSQSERTRIQTIIH